MDIKSEDTMVRQIEKNLSNNINENLNLTGRVLYNNKLHSKNNSEYPTNQETKELTEQPDYPLVSSDYISNNPMSLSRAEYIRQARESCLRQLSNQQLYCRPYDSNYVEAELPVSEQLNHKKARALRLFHDGMHDEAPAREQNSPQEIAAFRALIIRTVCAIVLFLFVFIIDKFEIEVGKITPDLIQEYVTGNDTFQDLEDIVVTWLN